MDFSKQNYALEGTSKVTFYTNSITGHSHCAFSSDRSLRSLALPTIAVYQVCYDTGAVSYYLHIQVAVFTSHQFQARSCLGIPVIESVMLLEARCMISITSKVNGLRRVSRVLATDSIIRMCSCLISTSRMGRWSYF